MRSYVSAALRRLDAERADYLRAYCLIHEDDTHVDREVGHLISQKHGGPTDAANLARVLHHSVTHDRQAAPTI
jgi:hypothetical protein